MKKAIIWTVAIVAVAGIGYWLYKKYKPAEPASEPSDVPNIADLNAGKAPIQQTRGGKVTPVNLTAGKWGAINSEAQITR